MTRTPRHGDDPHADAILRHAGGQSLLAGLGHEEVDPRAALDRHGVVLGPSSALPAKATRSSPWPGGPSSAVSTARRARPDPLVLAVPMGVPDSFDSCTGTPAAAVVTPSSSVDAIDLEPGVLSSSSDMTARLWIEAQRERRQREVYREIEPRVVVQAGASDSRRAT